MKNGSNMTVESKMKNINYQLSIKTAGVIEQSGKKKKGYPPPPPPPKKPLKGKK